MIRGALNDVVNRLQGDWDFISKFLNNKELALSGYALSKTEKEALMAGSVNDLISLGVEKLKAAAASSGAHSGTCCTGGSNC